MAEQTDAHPGRAGLALCTSEPATGALCYTSQELSGYRRERSGDQFEYIGPDGRVVTDGEILARFERLVIPPAWQDVWISPNPDSHIQATGRDVRGRKQYVYHEEWEEIRNETKFDRIVSFGRMLPSMRRRIDRDLHRPHLSRETALAFVVRLLEETLIRVGNEEYARQNASYGITTLRDHHVEVTGGVLRLKFKGKGGKEWEVDLRNPRLARLARAYQELPGQELLQYQDASGELHVIDSGEVNRYLRRVTGNDFTAKDFRTWGGTVCAAVELHHLGPATSEREIKKKIVEAVKKTARKLGNTPATCRKYYIHPQIFEGFRNASLFEKMSKTEGQNNRTGNLRAEEKAVLALLARGD